MNYVTGARIEVGLAFLRGKNRVLGPKARYTLPMFNSHLYAKVDLAKTVAPHAKTN